MNRDKSRNRPSPARPAQTRYVAVKAAVRNQCRSSSNEFHAAELRACGRHSVRTCVIATIGLHPAGRRRSRRSRVRAPAEFCHHGSGDEGGGAEQAGQMGNRSCRHHRMGRPRAVFSARRRASDAPNHSECLGGFGQDLPSLSKAKRSGYRPRHGHREEPLLQFHRPLLHRREPRPVRLESDVVVERRTRSIRIPCARNIDGIELFDAPVMSGDQLGKVSAPMTDVRASHPGQDNPL